jgi:NADPH2:quinone reductase
MPKAIRIHATGGPEEMRWEEADPGRPEPGEVRIAQKAVGLNFIDVYFRTGLYPLGELPATLGMEAAGIIEEVGAGVNDLKVGDRVVYCSRPVGAYAEVRVYPADQCIPLPESIDFKTGAAMLLKGMTAEYLLTRTYAVQPGDTILFHAAAGGVGLIACQWAKHIGATVIGTVGSHEKAKLARAHGCDHPIIYTEEDVAERVLEITDGERVPVVYDSVGAATWSLSLDCLRPRGMMVSFGNASGAVPPISLGDLAAKGSLFVTRPTLFSYVASRPELLQTAANLFEVVTNGAVRIEVNQTYPLAEAAQAHRDLEARKTSGSTVFEV